MFKWKDFDIHFVNLDHRTDRLLHMQIELARAGLEGKRFEALKPSDYKGPESKIQAMSNRKQKGAIGCHFSQMEIMKKSLVSGRPTLILEDDVVFADDIKARFAYIEKFLETHDYDIFFLGATFHCNPPEWHKEDLGRDVELTDDPRILRTYGIWSTYAWWVNPDKVEKVLDIIDRTLPESWGIDHQTITQLQPNLQCFCFVPGCCKQLDGFSDIGVGNDGKKARTHFSNFHKLGPYWWQPNMSDFDPTTFNWAEAKR